MVVAHAYYDSVADKLGTSTSLTRKEAGNGAKEDIGDEEDHARSILTAAAAAGIPQAVVEIGWAYATGSDPILRLDRNISKAQDVLNGCQAALSGDRPAI